MKRFAGLAILVAVAAVIIVAGASVLNLNGSDSAPGSGKGEAACAGPLKVTNPVSNGGHDNNRIVHMTIDGDMTQCQGQTLLVEVDIDTGGHAYAVHEFNDSVTNSLNLVFDVTTGDFYDTYPTAVGGTLVDAGVRLDPIKAKDFGLYTLTIASNWE